MVVLNRNSQDSPNLKKNETIFQARAVSRGIGIGKIVCLHGRKRQFYRKNLKAADIENEINRFQTALNFAKKQLKNIDALKFEAVGDNKSNIFQAHLMILEDINLISKIENTIRQKKINAEWCVKIVTDSYINELKKAVNGDLKERYIDLEDIAQRLQTALGGSEKNNQILEKNSIIVAQELNPSTLIELSNSQPQAIITERGGWTSHTFILARELNLPSVTGLNGILRRVRTGDEVIVDGFHGKIILHPKAETRRKYSLEAVRLQENKSEFTEQIKTPLNTLDNREITIRANVDVPTGYEKARKFGAQGIGLYRSEFLFNQYKGFPGEAEQIETYENAAQTSGEFGVRIRTFDLNAGQSVEGNSDREQNPALGLRGIRFGWAQKKQFQIQLRALLRASAKYKIDIILPMISDISEIIWTKNLLSSEKNKLKKQKIKYGNPQIGVMIEVPATIMIIEEIACEVDFLCLGTNDLVQYLLAVDRDNEAVADWFRTLHPAVLRSIKKVIAAADDHKTPIIICGEMAGSPVYAAILLGLGATELSMNPNSILRVRKTISGIAFEEAQDITKKLLKCATSDAVEQLVSELFTQKWSHLFNSEILPARKK